MEHPDGSKPLLRRRPEVEEDAAFLFALFRAHQGALLAGLDPAMLDMLLRPSFEGQRMTYRQRYPDARFEIVEDADGPVGRIVTDRGADALTLVDIALRPERCGRGLGTRLLAAVMDEARAVRRPLRLSVTAHNPGARRLYERLGFVPVQAGELHIELVWTPPAAS